MPSAAFGYAFVTDVENELSSNNDKNPIIEIKDLEDDVVLGLTPTSIYMLISEQARDQINKELQEAYNKNMESFTDSFGSFIVGEYEPLTDSKIEYNLRDIENVKEVNGILSFTYFKEYSVRFEDVLSTNGKQILANFNKQDIVEFLSEYKKI